MGRVHDEGMIVQIKALYIRFGFVENDHLKKVRTNDKIII